MTRKLNEKREMADNTTLTTHHTHKLTFVCFLVIEEFASCPFEFSEFLSGVLAVRPFVRPGVCKRAKIRLKMCLKKPARTFSTQKNHHFVYSHTQINNFQLTITEFLFEKHFTSHRTD